MHMPVDQQVPIACAGVTVMPGDVIVGDEEGVVVVPAAIADEVAAEAEQQELEEAWGMERVAAGESTDGAFPITPARRPEFEAWVAARTGARLRDAAIVRHRVDASTPTRSRRHPHRPARGVERHRRP